jgi:quinohemoprotein ethanol dehydrogenase
MPAACRTRRWVSSCLALAAVASCSSEQALDTKAWSNRGGANWAGYGGDESERHYSPLDDIDAGNVDKLALDWFYDIDVGPNAFAAPIVVDGIMYFAAGYSVVHALDARTGKLLWQYDPKVAAVAGERLRASWGIRGITFGEGKIFTGTLDGRLIALDARTGRPLWSANTVDPDDGRYITGPPTYFAGKVVIGHGGGDFAPVRGYVTAFHAADGRQAWRFYTVPGDPSKGPDGAASDSIMLAAAKTWTGEWWKHGGGGTAWNAITYDPKFNRIYIGTGNGAPWNQKIRSPGGGDNWFVCSIVAVDATTGKYVWHYQINPGETWDYNAAMDITLARLRIEDRERDVILHAPKNGFFYVIDRATGKLISAEKFARNVNWASRIDTKTGRPVENAAARYPNGKPFMVYPSPVGAHSVEAMAFNPVTGLVYLNAIEQGRVFVDPPGNLADWRFPAGQMLSTGVGAPKVSRPPESTNRLLAWDPVNQREAWSVPLKGNKNGGVMTSAGKLVFEGTITGELVAYHAASGKPLWSFDAQNGVQAQPISFSVGGKQYVSVITGWRYGTAGGPGLAWDYHKQKRRVLTFSLSGKAGLPAADRTPLPFVDDQAFELNEALAERGGAIYGGRCTICHGAGMNAGGTAPDLRKAQVPLNYEALTAVLRGGALVENGMPQYAELSPEEVRALQHFIRRGARQALAGKAPARPVDGIR